MEKQIMTRVADNIRILAATMVEQARSGHPGGAMGGADFINVLYSRFLVTDPDNPDWFCRDRMFLDPGHMSPMLYSVLSLMGFYSVDDLKAFRQWGSATSGHPELCPGRGVDNTSGPLGQGHAMAVGCAIAERFLAARFGEWLSHKTYTFISDGGIQEEIAQGAGRIAGHLGLSNLIMFFDSNGVQLSTDVDMVTTEDYAAKYRAWGWNVIEIDGSDPQACADALEAAEREQKRPTLIIGRTIMGRGCVTADGDSFEGRCSTHGQPLSKSGADYPATVRNLGGDPQNPWAVSDDARRLYDERLSQLRTIVAQRRARQAQWEQDNPELARELNDMLAGHLPEIDWKALTHKPGIATRQASSDVLGMLADRVNNMIVSSADLANSDKTDGFLKHTHPLTQGDFTGAFLHAGVSELTMAAVMSGIVLHGGLLAACGTFFVFSDYMKPVIRLAALMELPVKYLFSHDSFRVGEDGPTHQPIEQEAQLRLLEQVDNHSGRQSLLVLRPADSAETDVCWQMALENTHTPTALILSRQNVDDLPAINGDRRTEADGARRGAYVAFDAEAPELTLVGNGSDVGLLCRVAVLLDAEQIPVRVVSMPSPGLFLRQDEDYRQQVLPSSVPVYALSSGLPATFYPIMTGRQGRVEGLTHFGDSAPYTVLEEKYGFTVQDVLVRVKQMLGR